MAGFAWKRVTAPSLTRRRHAASWTVLTVVAALGLSGLLGTPVLAQTRESDTFTLNLPSQRMDEALLGLALQTRRSLGGDIRACRGPAPAIRGRMSLGVALNRLLAGSGCVYVIREDGAILVRRAPRPAPRPASPSATADREVATQVSDIVVTAERRAETPEEVATALTAIAASRFEHGGVTDMTGVAALTAGMTVTNLGSGRNKILLRGMSDGAFTGLTQSTVALYLNQIPITYSAPDPDLKLVDIDRIELLRGPQGTLFGAGSIGGVIRTMTRQPDFSGVYGDISLTRSETRSGGPNSDYSAMLNLPLMNGRAALRAVAYEESFDGYINDVGLNLPRVNQGSRRGGRVALAVRLAEEWNLGAGLLHQSIDTEDTHYVIRGLGRFRRVNLVREPHQNDFDTAYVTLDGQGDWGRLDASLGFVRHDFRSRYDASTALSQFGSRGLIGALDEDKDIDLLALEASWASPASARVRWLVGAFLSASDMDTRTTVSALRPAVVQAYGEDRSDQLEEGALFGEVAFDPTARLTLTAGLRYYDARYRVASQMTQGPDQRTFSGAGATSGFSPRLAAAWRWTQDWNVYAEITQGHRSGGFNTAGPAGQQFTEAVGMPGREYRPDTLWNYEAGAKGFLWNDRMRIRVAVFHARWNNIQSDQFLPSGLTYAVNVGDGANKGLEIETTWRPIAGLEIHTNALFADPEITRPSPAFNSRGDAGLPGVPAVSANLLASYHRGLWRDLELEADASIAYVGPSHLTFDAERRSRMGGYTTGRVSLGVRGPAWSATAFVDNPFDTEANTFSFGDPFRLPEGLAVTPLRPRTVGLTLSWSH